jgi:hypothetical protein
MHDALLLAIPFHARTELSPSRGTHCRTAAAPLLLLGDGTVESTCTPNNRMTSWEHARVHKRKSLANTSVTPFAMEQQRQRELPSSSYATARGSDGCIRMEAAVVAKLA